MVFLGPDTFNHYGHKLIQQPARLSRPKRAGRCSSSLHAWKTIRLTLDEPRGAARRHTSQEGRAGHTSRKSLASTTMIVSGLFLLVFVPLHVWRRSSTARTTTAADAGVRDLYRLVVEIFSRPGYVVFYVVGMIVVGFHLWHGVSSAFQTLGADTPRVTPRIRAVGWTLAIVDRRRLPDHPAVDLSLRGAVMTLDSKVPVGPAGRQVGPPQVRGQARQPRQQAQVHRSSSSERGWPARRRRHRSRELGYNVHALLHPRQPAPRAQHRRAGRHQRGEELQERRRQRLSPVLRHDQGRRLPRARSQRLPSGAAVGRTSSTSASRRACRSRASTAACSTTARSAARRCRARSTRAARRASSCCSAPTRR